MIRAILGILAGLLALASLLVMTRMREHRTDLTRFQSMMEGKSSIPQLNYLNPDNYDPRGKRLLLWHVLLLMAAIVSILTATILTWETG